MEYQTRDYNKKLQVSIEVDYKSLQIMISEIWRSISYRKLKISYLIEQGFPETDYRITTLNRVNEVDLNWHEQLQITLSKLNRQF